MLKKSKKLIYLDNAATTPVADEVLKAMKPFWQKLYGNPSSLHGLGVGSHNALEQARKTVSDILKCQKSEVIFTAGATESINLAILGYCRALKISWKQKNKPHIITSKIEHEAVLECCKQLEREGFKVTYLDVNDRGCVDEKEFKKSISPHTVFVSIMYSNNEIGSIQPIFQLTRIVKHINQERSQKIVFHTDAAQAAGYLNLNVLKLGVDMMSLNGSKIYGPKQTGCLFVRKDITLEPIIFGGGQERGLRSGTENTAGSVGFASALQLSEKMKEKEVKRVHILRQAFQKELSKKTYDATINTPEDSLPGTVNVSFNGTEGEALMLYLDSWNIAVSTGSACSTASGEISPVLQAIDRNPKRAKSAVRFSFGRYTTKQDLRYVYKVLQHVLPTLRNMKQL